MANRNHLTDNKISKSNINARGSNASCNIDDTNQKLE